MFYRYELDVSAGNVLVYHGCFSSINQLVKFACGFEDHCDLDAWDPVTMKHLPINELTDEFKYMSIGV